MQSQFGTDSADVFMTQTLLYTRGDAEPLLPCITITRLDANSQPDID